MQLTEALAEYWHARVRAELGFAGEDPDEPEDYFDLALPRRALLVRLPRLPRPGGPRQDGRAARAGADRRQAVRGVPAAPRAVDRRARRCTTPRRSTSTPSERRRCCRRVAAAVLFDMDGLLVDTEPIWFAVETEIMAELGGAWGRERPGGRWSAARWTHVARSTCSTAPAGPTSTPDELAQALLDGMVERLRPRPGELDARRRASCSTRSRRPACRRAGLLVASAPVVDAVLDAVGTERFAVTVSGDDVRATKPHPDPYLLAAELLGVDPAAVRRARGLRRPGPPRRVPPAASPSWCPAWCRRHLGSADHHLAGVAAPSSDLARLGRARAPPGASRLTAQVRPPSRADAAGVLGAAATACRGR